MLCRMAYITSYLLDRTKEEIEKSLKDSSKNVEINSVKKSRVGNFLISSQKNGFINGKIAVQRLYDDYIFDLKEGYEIEKKPKDVKKEQKTYPKDIPITKENAIVEMAKNIREMRDFLRDLSLTDAGRVRTAAWVTGYEFREALNIIRALAKKQGISTTEIRKRWEQQQEKKSKQKEKSKFEKNPT